MSVSFKVSAAAGDYEVLVRAGQFREALPPGGDRIFIADEYFAPELTDAGHNVIPIVAQEAAKSLDRAPGIIESMRGLGVSRKTTLVAVGGGVVQDIAGFVATIYMRGLSWIYVPTTLLGMADSCIGGKSSINVGPYKNLVGTFCPPQLVLIDPALAETLSVEQRVAGLCEAAKICFCRGEAPFKAYTDLSPKVDSPIATLTDVIALSLASKKWFIEVDEFDRGERLLLNFGHTFGHAVETASDFRISHGVAVGLGMIAARAFGFGLGRRHDAAATPEALFAHIDALLRQVPGLDRAVRTLEPDSLMSAFAADKKHSRDQFAVIVVDELGGVERLRLPRDAATTARVLSAFEATLERYAA